MNQNFRTPAKKEKSLKVYTLTHSDGYYDYSTTVYISKEYALKTEKEYNDNSKNKATDFLWFAEHDVDMSE